VGELVDLIVEGGGLPNGDEKPKRKPRKEKLPMKG
jgi:hypothetical protein